MANNQLFSLIKFQRTNLPWLMLGVSCALIATRVGAAQPPAWPVKPVRFIVGWPPVGGTDTIARLLAAELSKSLGQQVVVENRPGAGGRIGALSVVRAEPDGYTLLFATAAELTIAPIIFRSMQYNSLKDLKPITLVGRGPYMLIANPAFPPNTLAELIAYAKANPGSVNYASFGYGTIGHLLGEQFKSMTGINTVHVPYKGSAAAITDLVSGQIQYAFVTPLAGLVMVKAGKLKAIAVATAQRLPNADTIPTMSEAGLAGFIGGSWYALLVPAATPKPVIDRIHGQAVAALNLPELRKAIEDRTILPESSTPEALGRLMRSEIARFRQLAAEIGLQPE